MRIRRAWEGGKAIWNRAYYLVYGVLNLLDHLGRHRLGEVDAAHLGSEGLVQRDHLNLVHGRRHCFGLYSLQDMERSMEEQCVLLFGIRVKGGEMEEEDQSQLDTGERV